MYAEYFFVLAGVHGGGAVEVAGVVLVGVSFAVFVAASFAVGAVGVAGGVVEGEVVFLVGAVG